MKPIFGSARSWRLLPLFMFLASLSISVFVWKQIQRADQVASEVMFADKTDDITQKLSTRLRDHEQVLLGGLGFFLASNVVERTEWRKYISALKLDQNHPGILGVGYAVWLKPSQVNANIKKIKSEGFLGYHIRPPGDRPAYTSIIFLEPFDWRNQRAFGYDMFSEPVRREAMEAARDQGTTTISGQITLVQETERDRQAGFLIYIPHYRQGLPLDNAKERQKALAGFVYSPIRAKDFVKGTLGEQIHQVGFRLYEGNTEFQENLLYDSQANSPLPKSYRPMVTDTRHIQAYGRIWRLEFFSLPGFEQGFKHTATNSILVLGIVLSLLLAWITQNLISTRLKALSLAQTMTGELRALEGKWRSLSENSPDWIVSVSKNLIIENLNHPPFDLPFDGHIGSSILDLFSDPAKRQEVQTKLNKVLTSGTPKSFQFTEEAAWGLKHFETLISARFLENQINGLLLRTSDITTQESAINQLRIIKERLELVVEASKIGVWDWDLSSNRVIFDQGWVQMIGYELDEIEQSYEAWESRVHPDDLCETLNAIKAHISGQAPFLRTVFRMRHKNDHWVHILSQGKVHEFDPDGKPTRFTGTHTDISTEQEALAKLDLANQTKNKFFAIIAHDLKNPFNAILGGAELLKNEIEKIPPDLVDIVVMLDRAAKSAFQLLEDLLSWARAQNVELKAELHPLLPHREVEHLLEIIAPRAEAKSISIENRLPVELVVLADRKMLQEVLLNLITNSIKFSDPGKQVYIEGEIIDEKVQLSVVDQGIGVPKGAQKAMFHIDQHYTSMGTNKETGTGLGLNLAQEFMHKMGGQIKYDPTYQPGSRFVLIFETPRL
ncbi:MAG: hypothetical protein A2508_05900 [Candidatus Lambdaproteobacteria bacterium RIFOXYD12_FULL_49_8]|nr:MAG: hypothetical protein A2508_05900 [Candidatus Lambdaproteobacteria bacterium RIFOXYD12_FULL_49_8]